MELALGLLLADARLVEIRWIAYAVQVSPKSTQNDFISAVPEGVARILIANPYATVCALVGISS